MKVVDISKDSATPGLKKKKKKGKNKNKKEENKDL